MTRNLIERLRAVAPDLLADIAVLEKRIGAGWPETKSERARRIEIKAWLEDQI